MGTPIPCCRKNVQEKSPQSQKSVISMKDDRHRNLVLFSLILAKIWGPWLHLYCSLGPEFHFCTPEAAIDTEGFICCSPGTSILEHNTGSENAGGPKGFI